MLHREATAALPEVAKAEVSTLRQRLWKVGAIVKTSARRIWFHFSESWPHRELFVQVYQAIQGFVQALRPVATVVPIAGLLPLM